VIQKVTKNRTLQKKIDFEAKMNTQGDPKDTQKSHKICKNALKAASKEGLETQSGKS